MIYECIVKSPLWSNTKVLHLQQNIRSLQDNNFVEYLKHIGDRIEPTILDEMVKILQFWSWVMVKERLVDLSYSDWCLKLLCYMRYLRDWCLMILVQLFFQIWKTWCVLCRIFDFYILIAGSVWWVWRLSVWFTSVCWQRFSLVAGLLCFVLRMCSFGGLK